MKVTGIPFIRGCNGYADPDGRKYGIAIHNTSNNASASAEASYATRRTDGTSSHFYCDAREVIQSLNTSVRAGHAGSSNGNNHAVAVEITGVNAWTRQQWLDRVAWAQLGRVLAQVCKAYDIAVRRATVAEMQRNPKVQAFYSHDDMRRAWGGTTHNDPGPGFPWDRLFSAVNAAMHSPEPPTQPAASTPTPAPAPIWKDHDMLLLKVVGIPTVCLSWGADRGRVQLTDYRKEQVPLQEKGVPLLEVADEARLNAIGGPLLDAAPDAGQG